MSSRWSKELRALQCGSSAGRRILRSKRRSPLGTKNRVQIYKSLTKTHFPGAAFASTAQICQFAALPGHSANICARFEAVWRIFGHRIRHFWQKRDKIVKLPVKHIIFTGKTVGKTQNCQMKACIRKSVTITPGSSVTFFAFACAALSVLSENRILPLFAPVFRWG